MLILMLKCTERCGSKRRELGRLSVRNFGLSGAGPASAIQPHVERSSLELTTHSLASLHSVFPFERH